MSELTPAAKAKRTRLINEGIELSQEKKDCEARLREIQETLWDFAEAELAATGQKTCTFTTPQGSCEVTEATNLTIAEETVANLRAALGDRFDELVKTQEKLSITEHRAAFAATAAQRKKPRREDPHVHQGARQYAVFVQVCGVTWGSSVHLPRG